MNAYITTNREEEATSLANGKKIKRPAESKLQPLDCSMLPRDYEIKEDSKVQVIPIKSAETCIADRAKYGRVATRLPQDPGQAGKDQAQSFLKLLAGFNVKCVQESGDKVTRAEPLSAQWLGLEGMDKGNVDVLVAPWNEEFFNEYENFPQSKFKDMVDAGSSAFTELESGASYSAPPKDSQLGKSSYWK